MEIRQFKDISTNQKKELYNFIKSSDLAYNKSYIEMVKIYESNIFDDGNSTFILLNKEKIIGSAAVITKEISIKGEAFITDVYVSSENVGAYLSFLMKKVVEYCNIRSARNIKMGIRESETHIIPYIEAIEFTHIYDAVIMKHNRCKDKVCEPCIEIELQPLSILNSHKYAKIQNEAFENSPNGATIDEVDVKDYIIQYANNEDLIGICFAEKKECGIYELFIDDNIGWINTLGITPIYQRKGLGSALIVKCIEKLYEKDLDEVKLLVINSNRAAVDMYKKIGFQDEKVFSYWFEKNRAL